MRKLSSMTKPFSHILFFLLSLGIFSLFLMSCDESYTPKPRAYFRIDLPEKSYQQCKSDCPFQFDYPVYSQVVPDNRHASEKCWMNLNFPEFDAVVYISYKQVSNNLDKLTEDTRALTFKHVIKASDIREEFIMNDSTKVYGLIYDVKGDAASYLQFYLTDSTDNFLRGSLYFNSAPNYDSIAPVLDFIKKDVHRLVNSLEWK